MTGKSKLKKSIRKFCSDFAEQSMEETCKLMKDKAYALTEEELKGRKKALKQKMLQSFDEYFKKLRQAKQVLHEKHLVSSDILERLEGRLQRNLTGAAPKDESLAEQGLLGFSSEDILRVYDYARHLVLEGDNEGSSCLFLLLTSLLPQQKEFWIGYAFAEYQRKEYLSAFQAYNQLITLDTSAVDFSAQAADCLVKLEAFKEARLYLDTLIQTLEDIQGQETTSSENKEKYAALAKKLAAMRQGLPREQKGAD